MPRKRLQNTGFFSSVSLKRKQISVLLGTIVLGAVITFFFLPFFSPEPVQGEYEFMREGETLEWTIRKYHGYVNDTFNEYFSGLNDKLSRNGRVNQEIITPPNRDKEGNRDCSDDNLSTYCLAKKLTDAYIEYRENLLARQGNLSDALTCSEAKRAKQEEGIAHSRSLPATEVPKIISEHQKLIDDEIEYANQSLDIALAAYNEFQIAYPLHKKYEEIMQELDQYREQIYRIRRNVEKYPVKFVNVSTPNCT